MPTLEKSNGGLIMRVLSVNCSIDLLTGGGTAERTFQMSRHLALAGVSCNVLTLDLGHPEEKLHALKPASLVVLPCIWKRFYIPSIQWRLVRKLVKESDVVHLMGHWSVLNAFVYLLLRIEQKPYAVCPAGSLPIYGRSARIKRFYNWIIGRAIIANASAWIAVTELESAQFEAYGISASSVTVLPNGITKEDFIATDSAEVLEKHNLLGVPFILFMGRLNSIKGPDLLLDAFINVKDRLPDYHLVFAGPDGGMLAQLCKTVGNEDLADRVHFVGYVECKDKVALYRKADLLVVPSRHEAMSIVALEAGVCGTPVMLTDQCGFREVRTIDERLEVPVDIDGIADGLIALLESHANMEGIKRDWPMFIEQRYAWSRLAPIFIDLLVKISK